MLYRTIYLSDLGYVVYRHCFSHCAIDVGARVHKQAVFVDEIAAKDYCRYRNELIDKNGTDALPNYVGSVAEAIEYLK